MKKETLPGTAAALTIVRCGPGLESGRMSEHDLQRKADGGAVRRSPGPCAGFHL